MIFQLKLKENLWGCSINSSVHPVPLAEIIWATFGKTEKETQLLEGGEEIERIKLPLIGPINP